MQAQTQKATLIPIHTEEYAIRDEKSILVIVKDKICDITKTKIISIIKYIAIFFRLAPAKRCIALSPIFL
ncbi:MAG: hypothetical protein ACOYIG_06230, partial [Acetivibrionales bacterium]